MKRKVAIIGLDGATLDVIKPLIGKGILPNISKFIKEGVYGELKSTYPPITAAAWVSFMTGKNPGKHGIYDFMTKIPGMYVWEPTNVRINDTIWHNLGQFNKKVVVINVPMTYPPSKVNGILISGLGTPGENTVFTYPPGFKTVLKEKQYIIDIDWIPYFKKDKKVKKLITDLNLMTQKRYEITCHIVKNYGWDLLVVVFVGTDRIQHCLWNSIFDEKNEWHELVCQYYSFLDNIIGEILSETGDSDVIIMSDHGFGPFKYRANLNDWLHSIGLLTFKDSNKQTIHRITSTLTKLGINRKNIAKFFKFLGKDVDIAKLTPGLTPFTRVIDFGKTKAFSYCLNSIYINKKGKEKQGIVDESEYEKLRSYITNKLCDLTDTETGEKIVYKVCKKEEIYHGDKMEALPDLVITEYDERYIFGGYSTGRNKTGYIFEKLEGHSGNHKINGIFMAKGPSFKKAIEIKNAEIVDICPTVLRLFGVKVPQDMDGRVLNDALIFDTKPQFEIKNGFRPEEQKEELSEEERKKIVERLKGLGYL